MELSNAAKCSSTVNTTYQGLMEKGMRVKPLGLCEGEGRNELSCPRTSALRRLSSFAALAVLALAPRQTLVASTARVHSLMLALLPVCCFEAILDQLLLGRQHRDGAKCKHRAATFVPLPVGH